MFRGRIALFAASFAVILAAAPAAVAKKPGSTEHGVDRARLASKAELVIEERNGIDVIKISRCGPHRKKRRLDFSRWVCEWRAEGIWPGEVPYHCAGDARFKRKRKKWWVDPCLNRMQPLAPLLDVPNPHPAFGFNDNWIFQSNEAIDLLDQSGAGIARTSLAWSGVERDPGSYDWWGSDRLYEKLLERGIRPLWVVIDAPCWAQPDPGACASGNDQQRPAQQYYDEFARFAAAAAQRYPQAVAIEVWNEPNYPLFWGTWPEPEHYAKMLKQVADAVHGAAPGTPVVSGGLSPHADTDTHAIGFSNFLAKLYELGAAQKADAIGIHPYPGIGPTQDYLADVRVYLGKVQRVMLANNDADRPMWATEFGVSTTGEHAFEPSHQARALQEIYEILRRVHRVDLAIVHRFVEDPGLAGREGGFGVLSRSLEPKPAYCAMVQVRGVSPLPELC
jgi:hypothetical protein